MLTRKESYIETLSHGRDGGVTRFLTNDVLQQADPSQTPDRSLKLRSVLDAAAEQLRERFGDMPQVEARIRMTLANAYRAVGDPEAAELNARISRELAAD